MNIMVISVILKNWNRSQNAFPDKQKMKIEGKVLSVVNIDPDSSKNAATRALDHHGWRSKSRSDS